MSVRVIFNDIRGRTVNNLTGLIWTHVLIQLNSILYEATWPRVKKSYVIPEAETTEILEFENSSININGMIDFGEKNLGQRYMLRGYLFPKLYHKTRGVYCSEFACDMLVAGGFNLKAIDGYTPDTLYRALMS